MLDALTLALAAGFGSAGLFRAAVGRWGSDCWVAAGASFLLTCGAVWRLGLGDVGLVAGIIAGIAPSVVVIDLRSHRIPNVVTLVGSLVGLAVVVGLGLVTGQWMHVLAVLGVAVLVGVFYLVCALFAGLGLGDVKLAVALALVIGWLGWERVTAAVVLSTLVGVLLAGASVVRHRDIHRAFAFGPALVAGFFGACFLS